MDLLLRRSAPVSTPRERSPLFSDVHCPTDLPECLPPGRYRARLRRLEAERHSQRQQVSRRGRESVLHASCDTRRHGDDAGGHRPSRTVAGGWLEPKRSRRAPDQAAAHQPPIATDRSTRAVEDAAAEMGTACTRPDQRVLAAFGLLDGAPTHFEPCRDVSFGGVLCALPALAENGLFRHIHVCLAQLRGYYSTLHVIVLLAHMALCRIKTVEQ